MSAAALLLVAMVLGQPGQTPGTITLVDLGGTWRYFDAGTDPGAKWADPDFDDSAWKAGQAELGYGEGDEKTVISFGGEPKQKHLAYYFRKTFELSSLPRGSELAAQVVFDDGFMAYLNGRPLCGHNLPRMPTYSTAATETREGKEVKWYRHLDARLLRPGRNTIAVEVHQASRTSSDVSFDFKLALSGPPQRFYIRPYVQNTTPTAVTIMWETYDKAPSTVFYGPADAGSPPTEKAHDPQPVYIHKVRIEALKPESRYAYRVVCGEQTHDAEFATAPARNRPIRFAIIGDSRFWGTAWESSELPKHLMAQQPEFMIHMGDIVNNGHVHGQWTGHFKRFGDEFARIPMFPCRGNHEGDHASDPNNDWYAHYHDLPGQEPFLSFDWGNTHFAFVSYTHIDQAAPVLDRDLGATDKPWKVAYWHFPVYCTGYPSATDSRKAAGNKTLEAVLDKHRVDLCATGHTHIYERSFPYRAGHRDDREGVCYLVQGGNVGGHFEDRWTAVVARDMDMPHYTMVWVNENTMELRSYGLEKGRHRRPQGAPIVEVDRYIRWRDESVPQAELAKLATAKGDDLIGAIDRLGAMIYGPAAPKLVGYLNSEDAALRRAAALALERIGSEEVAEQLVPYLDHGDLEVRRRAARSLEIAMPARLGEELAIRAMAKDQDRDVRMRLLGALRFHAPQLGFRVAMGFLGSEDALLCERAADVVKRTAREEDIDRLLRRLATEPQRYVAVCLGWALNRLTGKQVDLRQVERSKPGQREALLQQWAPSGAREPAAKEG